MKLVAQTWKRALRDLSVYNELRDLSALLKHQLLIIQIVAKAPWFFGDSSHGLKTVANQGI